MIFFFFFELRQSDSFLANLPISGRARVRLAPHPSSENGVLFCAAFDQSQTDIIESDRGTHVLARPRIFCGSARLHQGKFVRFLEGSGSPQWPSWRGAFYWISAKISPFDASNWFWWAPRRGNSDRTMTQYGTKPAALRPVKSGVNTQLPS